MEATAHNSLDAREKEAFSKGISGIDEDGLKYNILIENNISSINLGDLIQKEADVESY